uniref:Uncharacterized protein n=1 Tax=Romanomermis culicivorax TaxID=13658 RepID=A0A915I3B9_ROMCU
MEEKAREKIRLQWEQMEEELRKNIAIYNEKVHQMAIQFGLQKDDTATPEVEKKVLEPPSPMKVDNDIPSKTLVIDESIAETPEPEMTESKETQESSIASYLGIKNNVPLSLASSSKIISRNNFLGVLFATLCTVLKRGVQASFVKMITTLASVADGVSGVLPTLHTILGYATLTNKKVESRTRKN